MKKVFSVICALGILASISSSAMAKDSWTMLLRPASDRSGSSFFDSVGTLQMGTRADANDSIQAKDGYDGFYTQVQGSPAMAFWFRPDWSAGDPNAMNPWTWANMRDFRAPLTTEPNLVKSWDDLVVWALPGYTAPTIKLYIYTTSAAQPPVSIDGKRVAYKFQLTYAPAGYVGQTEWIFDEIPTSAATAFVIELPSAGAIVQNPITGVGPLEATQTAGYRFSIVTPEPGTMAVLATGLAGMVGMISRRRKA